MWLWLETEYPFLLSLLVRSRVRRPVVVPHTLRSPTLLVPSLGPHLGVVVVCDPTQRVFEVGPFRPLILFFHETLKVISPSTSPEKGENPIHMTHNEVFFSSNLIYLLEGDPLTLRIYFAYYLNKKF